MTAPTFDLQSHSLHSDGHLDAGAVVVQAAAAGVQLLALTDHDTTDGVDEALASARRSGIRVVPAVEISTIDDQHADLHILGYGIDHHDPVLAQHLLDWRADRSARVERMEATLRNLGWEIDDTVLDARRAEGKPVGRPHLAQALFSHPANVERLQQEGLTNDFSEVLVAYLVPGAPAFGLRTTPTIAEAVDAIHAAGGVAVWAHPFWDVDDPDAVVATLRRFRDKCGMDGVEAFYATHTEAQTKLLVATARDLDMLTTGSADFHGPYHPHFNRFRAFGLYGEVPNLGPIADSD